MYASQKKENRITPEAEADFIAEAIKKHERLKKTVRFKYLVRNKNIPPKDLEGLIVENVNVNGHNMLISTFVTEAEARRFQEDKFLMFMFS